MIARSAAAALGDEFGEHEKASAAIGANPR
jgi:hypothetical protein